ncbi:hypothetical protein NDU88_007623 [Pleurodeles waltl]|uniref:Uncharacterized protein n=1 Tax=Pleurodeles waltl TaxID=8319 RepID=A0AAV7QQE2_PLEWA|nr:hypothetical protein NDU88_007623 [Pleurodeles waltl]
MSGGQRGTTRGRACTDCATSRARSFGRCLSTGPASSRTHFTSRHHKGNLGSFSGVSLVAISHKTIPKLLTVGILLVGEGVKQLQLQQRGKGGREALLGPRAESLQQEGGAPPRSLSQRLPAPPRCFINSPYALLPLDPTVAAAAGGLPDVLSRLSWDHGCCCLPLPPGIQSAVGAVGNRVLAFSHSRREPPGRGVWCVFVRCVENLNSKSLAQRFYSSISPQMKGLDPPNPFKFQYVVSLIRDPFPARKSESTMLASFVLSP